MPALILLFLGLACLAAAWLLLRSFGGGVRIGRLLSVAPDVTIAEALDLARRDPPAYVRVRGRIDADEPFPDEFGRPLVVRRERVLVREGSGWRTIGSAVRHVPFVLRDREAEIAIDAGGLDEGLVVIPREAEGRAGDIAERFATSVDPSLPVRFQIHQVSAVEHAIAVGGPTVGPDGDVRLGPARGRPLIVTTLEVDEAMRVLAGGRRQRAIVVATLLAVGLACLAAALVLIVAPMVFPAIALGASPEPSVAPGDTRSSGEGPGLAGQPFLVAVGVILLGLAAAALATLYVRLARQR